MAFNSNNGSSSASNNNNNNEESIGTKKKNLIIVVEEGSLDKLNELFDLQNKKQLERPMKMRNLPHSFFNPPSSGSKSPSGGCHSRENSNDSGAFASGATAGNGLQIHHSRAHSSPASLGKINLGTLGGLPIAMNSGTFQNASKINNISNDSTGIYNNFQNSENNFAQPKGFLHSRGRSYDQTNLYQHHLGDLPQGWEQAKTSDGKVYYINHNEKTTQWDDPRGNIPSNPPPQIFSSQSSIETFFAPPVAPSNQNMQTPSNEPIKMIVTPTSILQSGCLGPLPEGWEENVTNKGERYYINHINRTTTWRDPRLSSNEFQAAQEQQQQKIRDLLMERESLRRRQQEIKSNIGGTEDPFLGSLGDSHIRQESGDSGLSQSIPHTPDFLSTIDSSMDELTVGDSMDTVTFDNSDEFMLDDSTLFDKLIEPANKTNIFQI